MAEKDVAEKLAFDYEDIFADIVNVLLFNGERVVKEEEIVPADSKSQYKIDAGDLREQDRDIAKYWIREGKIRFAFFGLENQTDIDGNMPVRVMSYDAGAYKKQYSGKKTDKYFPVVTLVLYFGTKKRWDKAKSLWEIADVPEKLKPYVSDYKINVFEIAWLDDETVEKFESDFRQVAEYFVCKRKNIEPKDSEKKLKHVNAIFELLRALEQNEDFAEEYVSRYIENNKEGITVSEYWRNMMDESRNEGRNEGREEGILLSIKKMMAGLQLSARKAMEVLEIPPAEYEKYDKLLLARR